MMAEPHWEFQDGLMPPSSSSSSNGPPHSDKFDDDLFSAALFFLDHPYGETDTDSHSTPEPPPPQEQQPLWHTVSDGPLDSFERPAKKPRHSPAPSSVKLEAENFPCKEEPDFCGNMAGGSSLWENQEQTFRPAAPRRVNKRKEEIGVLRIQAETLQARLDALHKQPLVSQRDDRPSMGGVLAWQDIAAQQSEQRKVSESENRRLKELAAEHRRVAKALKRIAARQNNSKSWDPFRPFPAHPKAGYDNDLMLDDPNIFGMLLASMDQLLQQTDSMMTEDAGRFFHCERHGDSHLTAKLQDSRLVPFGLAETASAVWHYTLLNETVKQQQWAPATDGSFQSEFIAHVDLGEFRGHAEGKLVVRRVEEPGRTIIVRHSLFHCLTAGALNRFLTVPMRHFLWTVIDRPPKLRITSGRNKISRIRTCAVSLPRLDVGDLNDPTREAAIEELKKICAQISIQQSEQSYDLVDNMLLGSAPPSTGKGLPCQSSCVPVTDKVR